MLTLLASLPFTYNIAASDWPHTFLQPGCFCLALYWANCLPMPSSHVDA